MSFVPPDVPAVLPICPRCLFLPHNHLRRYSATPNLSQTIATTEFVILITVLTQECLTRLRTAPVITATSRAANGLMVKPHQATLPMRANYSTASAVNFQIPGISTHNKIGLADRMEATFMSNPVTPNAFNVPSNLPYHKAAKYNDNSDKSIRIFRHSKIVDNVNNNDLQNPSYTKRIADTRNVSLPNEVQTENDIPQTIRRAKMRFVKVDDASHAEQMCVTLGSAPWLPEQPLRQRLSAMVLISWWHNRLQTRDHSISRVHDVVWLHPYLEELHDGR